ncbi:MAG: MFS transporter [Actinobacteria bacterium]|jgi:MFS family permease|nr:MAG: MFS transporter [Actinomycetota bacterium]
MKRPSQAVSELAALARNENLRRVELAWGASIAAEWTHFVALGVFAYNTGGASAVGIAGLVRMLPAALVAPFAATLGDRFRRERFLVVVSLAGSAALGGSAAAYFVSRSELIVFALAAVVGVTSTIFRPALQATLPSLARTPQELIASNGATSTFESLGTLLGPLVAGILVTVADVGVVFLVAAAALLVAAGLLQRVQVEGRIQATAPEEMPRPRELLAGGFRAVVSEPRTRLLVFLTTAQSFVRGALNVLIVVGAFRVLGAGAGAVGYLTAAVGVGGLVGAFGALSLKGRQLAVPFGVSLIFWGLPIALIPAWPRVAVAFLLLAVVGAANSVEDVAVFTLLQRVIPDDVLTRVLGIVWGLAMGAIAIGSVAATGIVALVGSRAAFVVVGAILPLTTLIVWRQLVRIDREMLPPADELAIVEGVPMFAPLSIAAKEHMAARLVEVPVSAGEVVIRTGEAGDRFYMVADGALEVTNGVHARARRGDFFGELALLRDIPRTATVIATTRSRLYALERDDFLAAVTGHSGVRAAGEAVVEQRLRPA